MTASVAFVDGPEAITAGWLTEALARSFPGVEVVGVETLDQHSGTTGRLRLGLSYAPGPEGPVTVFVKLPPFDESQRFGDELAWLQPAMRGAFGARLVASARGQFADRFPPVFTDLCVLYEEHHERITELLDEGEQTLIHGDTHAGNQFLDGDQVGLYDWAVISRSPGIRDVAIYLGNSCPTEVRRARQDEWLHRYHQVLVEAGVDAPSFETLWLRFRRTVLYAWIAAATTASMGSKWQPIEVGMLGMTRATDACADVGTVDALRDAL